MVDQDAPFSRVGIVGLGLIGGSVALAARRAWPGITVAGFDHAADTAAIARRDAVHAVVERLDALDGSDLIVLAVPIAAMLDLIPVFRSLRHPAVITDVGSTKREVMAASAAARLPSFVGGHPMAGSERGGFEEARADLFAGRPWLLVSAEPDSTASRLVERFVAGLGAVPKWIDPDAHDRTVAYISHLPQIISVALMNAATEAIGTQGLSAAGRAFDEMTRLASSPPDMWDDILGRNADFVAEALARFVGSLPSHHDLRDDRWVLEAFERAGRARARAGEARTQPR